MAYICPGCGKDDLIRKVSAVVDAQVTHTHTTGTATGMGYALGEGPLGMMGAINVSSYSATRTAQRLSPPQAPRIDGCLLLGVIGCALFFILLMVIVEHNIIVEILDDPNISRYGMAPWVFLYVVLDIIAITLIITTKFARKEIRQVRAEYQWWERMIALWWDAYYCSRCDRVAIPPGVDRGLPGGWWFSPNDLHGGLLSAIDRIDGNTRELGRPPPG